MHVVGTHLTQIVCRFARRAGVLALALTAPAIAQLSTAHAQTPDIYTSTPSVAQSRQFNVPVAAWSPARPSPGNTLAAPHGALATPTAYAPAPYNGATYPGGFAVRPREQILGESATPQTNPVATINLDAADASYPASSGMFVAPDGTVIDGTVVNGNVMHGADGGGSPGFGDEAWGAQPWTTQFFPNGLVYRSYLAGVKESRFGVQIFQEKDDGWLWDITLGGRVGLVRYGTTNSERPEGFQIDMEGAAFPRLDPESQMDLNAADFRFGIPVTYGVGPWQVKLAYYHISSHLGDEYLLRNNLNTRFNYARDAIVLGTSYFATPSIRVYAEADWAFYQDVARPWAFQFGAEYSPPGATGPRGTPFVAFNGHLRQELDYSGHVTAQLGWQWRSPAGHMMRVGAHYLNGLNPQFALYNDFEEQLGAGLWYDY